MHELFRLALCGAVLALLARPAPAQLAEIVIGVRADAQPFAWLDEETGDFKGYLRDLCDEAADRAGYDLVVELPVSATQRQAILDGDPTILVTEDGPPRQIDVLCDPTTISLTRMTGLLEGAPERLVFSPILFVANGSFMTRGPAGLRFPLVPAPAEGGEAPDLPPDPPDPALVDQLAACTWASRRGVPFDPADSTATPRAFLRAGYVTGATSAAFSEPYLRSKGTQVDLLCLLPQPSHSAGVGALCNGALDLYFGDLDIIEAYRKEVSDRDGADCLLKPGSFVLSYEPYALLVSDKTPGFRPRFIAALYEMFSDGTALRIFGGYFPNHSKSTALNILFRINSIP
jgi:ABC-type amino acid transport substrate-binding protein